MLEMRRQKCFKKIGLVKKIVVIFPYIGFKETIQISK